MSWSAEVLGYENWEGDRYEDIPDAPEDAAGLYVHYHDSVTGEDKYNWVWTYEEFYDFDEWVTHIALVAGGHGVELA